MIQNLRDEFRDFANFGLAESSRGDCGTAEAHPARIERGILIKRNRVAVGGNVRGLERRLRIQIPDEGLSGIETIRDLLDEVEKRLV